MIKVSSIAGPSHRKNNLPNQDAYSALFFEQYTIAAVADGAGSKENARLGAEYTAEWTTANIVNNLQLGQRLEEALNTAIEMTREELKQLDNYKSYGATLAAAIKENDTAYIRTVGDSFAVVDSPDGLILVKAEEFNPAPNITTFLTSDSYETSDYYGDAVNIFLCTDGMEFGSLQGGEIFDRFWQPLITNIKEVSLAEVLQSMEEAEKIVDDTTILAIVDG